MVGGDLVEFPNPPSEASSSDRDSESADPLQYVYETDGDDDVDDGDAYDDGHSMLGGGEVLPDSGEWHDRVMSADGRNAATSGGVSQAPASVALTCAPNPVPLHIALENDLANELQLCLSSSSASAAVPSQSNEITKMANHNSATHVADGRRSADASRSLHCEEEDEEPAPADDDVNTRPRLAREESLSSDGGDAGDDLAALSADAQLALGNQLDLLTLSGVSLESVRLPYYTPPTGSPECSSSSNDSTTGRSAVHSSSRESSVEIDLVDVVPIGDDASRSCALSIAQLHLLTQQLQQHQLLQHRLAVAKGIHSTAHLIARSSISPMLCILLKRSFIAHGMYCFC